MRTWRDCSAIRSSLTLSTAGRRGGILLAALGLLACGSRAPAGKPGTTILPPGGGAVCGAQVVTSGAIEAVAQRQHVTVAVARERLVQDACFAAGAEGGNLPMRPAVRVALRAVAARALLTELHRSTDRAPTAEELRRFRAEHWREFDRPASLHVLQAVLLAETRPGVPVERPDSAALEARLFAATRETTSPEEFRRAAEAILAGVPAARIEDLPPFAGNGRVLTPPDATMEPAFVEAAQRLASAIPPLRVGRATTSFGHHVLFLVDTRPAERTAEEELARFAAVSLHADRSRGEMQRRLRELRERSNVSVGRNVDDVTSVLVLPPVARP